jgi:hypothetical protein
MSRDPHQPMNPWAPAPPLLALDELAAAVRDAQRRHRAGDPRALESYALDATMRQAEATLDAAADPRFAEPVGENEVAGLAVAFKALLVRAGGRVEITEAELLHARTLLARVDADPQVMRVEVIEGAPPDTPRFAAGDEASDDAALGGSR